MGLDTLARVYINGEKVIRTNNMHRTYRLNIKPYLVLGENSLQIDFESPTKFIAKEQAKDPLWGVSSTIPGYEYIRKGHHMFGWDWGPQLPDMGIWRDVNLYAYTQGRLETFYVRQKHKDKHVELSIDVDSHLYADNLTLSIKLQNPNGQIQSISVDAAQAREIDMVVENPMLWWPNGYGQQNLYRLSIQLLDGDRILDQIDKEIGLRTMTIHREPDTWGETFDYTINGVRIFAMGANYIPEDGLISRPDKARTERLIRDCAKANYNCIRVWGGGIYPSDTFFEMCDRYGLIVWEDFMFACGVYRLTKSFEENIRAEFIDNIKRIRHHACLGLWCGNNEMEEGFVSWGIPEDERLRMDSGCSRRI
jgi:beta-mannosidase